MEKKSKKKALLAASVAGLMAVAGAMAHAAVVYAADVHCVGINACKGQGECGGEGSSCAGKNACKGMGWVTQKTEADCTLAGGKVLPAKPAQPAA